MDGFPNWKSQWIGISQQNTVAARACCSENSGVEFPKPTKTPSCLIRFRSGRKGPSITQNNSIHHLPHKTSSYNRRCIVILAIPKILTDILRFSEHFSCSSSVRFWKLPASFSNPLFCGPLTASCRNCDYPVAAANGLKQTRNQDSKSTPMPHKYFFSTTSVLCIRESLPGHISILFSLCDKLNWIERYFWQMPRGPVAGRKQNQRNCSDSRK